EPRLGLCPYYVGRINQNSRKKKNSSSSSSSSSSRNNNIISNRQMTGLKRQKPTAERPRNVRGGA
ncbi:hypothetical protein M9G53_004822, partial [Escherichia coli]|nr:hypothetical protein [Escherichia coli]EJF8437640.1 hypothetical protein [Escherichia coli]